jgi:hypothetical protein
MILSKQELTFTSNYNMQSTFQAFTKQDEIYFLNFKKIYNGGFE